MTELSDALVVSCKKRNDLILSDKVGRKKSHFFVSFVLCGGVHISMKSTLCLFALLFSFALADPYWLSTIPDQAVGNPTARY